MAAILVAVAILAAGGAWYIWSQRTIRGRVRGGAFTFDLSATTIFQDAFPATAPAIAPFAREETAPPADGSTKWKKKLLSSSDQVDTRDRRGGDIPPEAAGTDMVLLHAELDRMMAENERMLAENAILRQRTEPPAYSEDGALREGDTDGVAVSKQV